MRISSHEHCREPPAPLLILHTTRLLLLRALARRAVLVIRVSLHVLALRLLSSLIERSALLLCQTMPGICRKLADVLVMAFVLRDFALLVPIPGSKAQEGIRGTGDVVRVAASFARGCRAIGGG